MRSYGYSGENECDLGKKDVMMKTNVRGLLQLDGDRI
jgi:hypothetical protein